MASVGLLCIALSSIGVFRVMPELAVFLGPLMFCASIGVFVGGRLGMFVGSIVGLWGSAVLYAVLVFWTMINM